MNPKLKLTEEGICVFKEDSHLSRWVEEHKNLDAGVYLPFLKDYLPVGGNAIDVGSSLGDHTVVYARRVGQEGNVFAFDANDEAIEALTYNMKPYPWVTIYHQALADKATKASIVRLLNVGASYLLEDPVGTIPCLSLDEVAKRDNWLDLPIHFLKIDAEGWEPRILRGAAEIIKRHQPAIWLEINRLALGRQACTPEALIAQIDCMGYTTYPEPKEPEYDMLAIPK